MLPAEYDFAEGQSVDSPAMPLGPLFPNGLTLLDVKGWTHRWLPISGVWKPRLAKDVLAKMGGGYAGTDVTISQVDGKYKLSAMRASLPGMPAGGSPWTTMPSRKGATSFQQSGSSNSLHGSPPLR